MSLLMDADCVVGESRLAVACLTVPWSALTGKVTGMLGLESCRRLVEEPGADED